MTTSKAIVIIPTRMEGSRLPGKPMRMAGGKPLLAWTYEQAKRCKKVSKVIVTSPDKEIKQYCKDVGIGFISSSKEMNNGTSRCGSVIDQLNGMAHHGVVINWQVDEPNVNPEDVDRMVESLLGVGRRLAIRTLATETKNPIENPNVVKCIVDERFCVRWFTRQWILGSSIHIGVYGFTRESLLSVSPLVSSFHSKLSDLEQLTWIEHGHKIGAVMVERIPLSINTIEDYDEWRKAVDSSCD